MSVAFAEEYKAHLDSKGLRYQEVKENVIRVGFNGKNSNNLETFAFFKEGSNKAAIASGTLASFKDDKVSAGIVLCNQLNEQYRFVKFYIDEDQDLICRADAFVSEGTAGSEVTDRALLMIEIMDEAYPTIMKVLWA